MKQSSLEKPDENWSIAEVWNSALVDGKQRPAKERANLWASELGKPNIELFLKMCGVPETNPPNERSKRKFSAGNLIEWLVQVILNRAGILQSSQDWVAFQYPGLLEVTGKLDFVAGGVPDYQRWEQWEELMKKLGMPDMYFRINEALKEHFQKKFPQGLAETILEIKSCSEYSMTSMQKTGKSSRNHRLQCFHYLKSKNHKLGRVVYICKDDQRMFEVPVRLTDKKIEEEYRTAIEQITGYYNAHKDTPLDKFLVFEEGKPVAFNAMDGMPPLEKSIVWDEDYQKFVRNWGVEYSSYLTLLYGYTDQMMFEDAVVPVVARWNSAMKRLKKIDARILWLGEAKCTEDDVKQDKIEGSRKKTPQYIIVEDEKVELPKEISGAIKLSPQNLESIEDIKNNSFEVEKLVAQFAGDGGEEEEV